MNSTKSKEEGKLQRAQKEEVKKQIINDLQFGLLRDELIFYVQYLLSYNLIPHDSKYFTSALETLNTERLNHIVEERVTLKSCCNLSCAVKVSDDKVEKVIKRKYQILKNGSFEKVEQPIIFCDKEERKVLSDCEKKFKR